VITGQFNDESYISLSLRKQLLEETLLMQVNFIGFLSEKQTRALLQKI
jgi:hypothetical protein